MRQGGYNSAVKHALLALVALSTPLAAQSLPPAPEPVAAEWSGIPVALSRASLDSVGAALLARCPGPVFTVARAPGGDSSLAQRWARVGRRKLESMAAVLDSMRVVKDADEIARLRRAAQITAEALNAAMRRMRPQQHDPAL
jgi:Xaa-Pro aminopeptidase